MNSTNKSWEFQVVMYLKLYLKLHQVLHQNYAK